MRLLMIALMACAAEVRGSAQATAISAGSSAEATCALLPSGKLKCWGFVVGTSVQD